VVTAKNQGPLSSVVILATVNKSPYHRFGGTENGDRCGGGGLSRVIWPDHWYSAAFTSLV